MTSGHVAIVLPGRAYGPAEPVLRYPAAALTQVGAEVRAVRYPDVSGLSGADDDRFHSEVAEIVRDLASDAGRVTLIGKSLGTAVMALLPDGVPSVPTDAIWLTPVFGMGSLGARAAQKRWRSLFVYGTADAAHDAAAQADVTKATGGLEVAIEGADHGLEVQGDVLASIAAMHTCAAAVLEFVTANRR